MKRAPIAAALALGAALACAACGGPRTATVSPSDVDAVREEQTPDKLLERGRAFAAVRDFTRAEQYFAAALEAGAPPRVALPLLLKVCVAENRFRAALHYAEPHLQAHPEDFRLRFVVASLHASIGQTEPALQHLAQVAKEQPDYAEVQYAMAVLLRDGEHDLVLADKHFREYLRLEPQGRHAPEARASLLKVVTVTDPRLPPASAAPAAPSKDSAAPPRPAEPAGEVVAPPSPPPPAPEPPASAEPVWKTIP